MFYQNTHSYHTKKSGLESISDFRVCVLRHYMKTQPHLQTPYWTRALQVFGECSPGCAKVDSTMAPTLLGPTSVSSPVKWGAASLVTARLWSSAEHQRASWSGNHLGQNWVHVCTDPKHFFTGRNPDSKTQERLWNATLEFSAFSPNGYLKYAWALACNCWTHRNCLFLWAVALSPSRPSAARGALLCIRLK